MKKVLLILLPLTMIFLQSCNEDFGKVEVSYTKATAIYGDLEDIRNTPLIADAQPIVNAGKIFVANDLLLVGEETKGIHVVDNTNPENPTNTSFINIPGNREFFVKGDILYAESHYDLLKIDLSDKNNPRITSRAKDAFANSENFKDQDGKTLIRFDFEQVTEEVGKDSEIYQQLWGHQDIYYYDYAQNLIPPSQVPTSFAGNGSGSVGSVNRIAAVDNNVYVISRQFIFPFEDNGNLEAFDKVYGSGNMETIYPNEGRLYIGTQQSMEVYDLSTPNQPQFATSFWHATSCDPVLPCGDVAYVTLRTGDVGDCPGDENSLLVLDVRTNNVIAHQTIEMESPFGMTLANNKLYVGEGQNGLKVYDATDKSNIQLESWEEDIEAYDIIHHPTNPNLLLIAGPNGISQYTIEGGIDYSLLSTLTF